MKEEESETNKNRYQRRFSVEERRGYCVAWEASDLNQIEFCKVQGISKSALSKWYKAFKGGCGEDFSPVILDKQSVLRNEERIPVEICFSSQLRLVMEIHPNQLSGLIKEVSHAASVIR